MWIEHTKSSMIARGFLKWIFIFLHFSMYLYNNSLSAGLTKIRCYYFQPGKKTNLSNPRYYLENHRFAPEFICSVSLFSELSFPQFYVFYLDLPPWYNTPNSSVPSWTTQNTKLEQLKCLDYC